MHLILFLLLLVCANVSAEDDLQWFSPQDRSFVVQVPGSVRAVEQENGRYLWGVDTARFNYLFGYAEIPRAASMTPSQLIPALGQFLSGFMKTANSPPSGEPKQVEMLGLPAVQLDGSAARGVHRARAIALGGRVYVLSCEGVKLKEAERFWASFKPKS